MRLPGRPAVAAMVGGVLRAGWPRSQPEPGREGREVAAGGNEPAFLIRVPVGAQGLGAILIGEGDVQGRVGGGDPRRRGFDLCGAGDGLVGRSAGGEGLEHGAIIGADEPIEEALALEGEPFRG